MRTLLALLIISLASFQSVGGKAAIGGKVAMGGGVAGSGYGLVTGVSPCSTITSGANCTVTSTGANHLELLFLFVGASTATFSAVADGASHTFTQVPGAACSQSTAGAGDMWYYPNSTAGTTTVTATTSTSTNWAGVLYELSGTSLSSPLDVVGAPISTAAGSNPVGPSITTTQEDIIVETVMAQNAVTSIFAGNPFTAYIWPNSNGSAFYIPTAGTYNAQWTGGSQAYCSLGAAFH